MIGFFKLVICVMGGHCYPSSPSLDDEKPSYATGKK